jgi:hypothetical protein
MQEKIDAFGVQLPQREQRHRKDVGRMKISSHETPSNEPDSAACFLGLIPERIAGQTRFVGAELDSITARIAKALYPQETILHSGFQRVPLPDGEFTFSIGNPPFGSESLRFSKPELYGQWIHNQFFLASLDALRPGGLHVAVVSHFLPDAKSKAAREKMAAKADLLGAIRLPDTAFKENARTEVVTDVVVMQRRTPEDEQRIRDLLRASEAPGKSKDAETTRRAARQQLRETAPWIETGEVSDPLGGAPMPVNQYFADHPEMVGRLERSGTMHVPDELAEIARSGYPEKADDDPRRAAGRPIHQRHHCLPRPHLLISGQMTRYAVTQRRCSPIDDVTYPVTPSLLGRKIVLGRRPLVV